MIPLNRIEELVTANKGVVGIDFHQKLHSRLAEALQNAPDAEDIYTTGRGGFTEEGSLFAQEMNDTFQLQIKELQDHLCLDDDYQIPSHRGGILGRLNRFVKFVIMKLKLRTDVQVSQQAKFNLAVLVSLELQSAQLEMAAAAIESLRNELGQQKESHKDKIRELETCISLIENKDQ